MSPALERRDNDAQRYPNRLRLSDTRLTAVALAVMLHAILGHGALAPREAWARVWTATTAFTRCSHRGPTTGVVVGLKAAFSFMTGIDVQELRPEAQPRLSSDQEHKYRFCWHYR